MLVLEQYMLFKQQQKKTHQKNDEFCQTLKTKRHNFNHIPHN